MKKLIYLLAQILFCSCHTEQTIPVEIDVALHIKDGNHTSPLSVTIENRTKSASSFQWTSLPIHLQMILKDLYNMEIKDYVNKWIASSTIYWKDIHQEIDNLQYVKEEDRDFAKNNIKLIFGKCIGVIENYLIIQDKRGILRIMPKLVANIYPTPKFEWGDKVQEVQRPEIKGEIENLLWHMKDDEFKYFIKINGKSKSRRYNPEELEFLKENI